jgi:hypothetical protein
VNVTVEPGFRLNCLPRLLKALFSDESTRTTMKLGGHAGRRACAVAAAARGERDKGEEGG